MSFYNRISSNLLIQNPNCDGSRCEMETGEVRLYPLAGGANLILCRSCFDFENRWRLQRARETGCPENWPAHSWHEAEVYP